jgi:hypothetical protein
VTDANAGDIGDRVRGTRCEDPGRDAEGARPRPVCADGRRFLRSRRRRKGEKQRAEC